ncbi:MAG TPA: protein kinase [Polyangiaceae bacterium]|nr:protein kinase [Polyangiaceae bacterium]
MKPGPLRTGDTFLGKYEIRSLLGRGGHAFVYEAYDPFLDRVVAIKVIKGPQDTGRDLGKRARYEAQVLSRIDHKNLVKVIDAGISEGLVYLIMEKLVGRTLRDVLKETHRVSVAEALTIGLQVADGMDLAHRGQVIHRDLKPENIFIEAGNALKVLDFGIAKVLGITGHRPETTEKDLLQGTVLYMSPEHLQGFGVTPKSDIYALGTILFESLYSHPLAIGDRPAGLQEAAWMQIARMPPMLDELDPAIPHFVAKLVQRAIVKMPEQRYATMRDFREALSAALTRLRDQAKAQPNLFVLRDLSGTQPEPAAAAPSESKRAPRDTVRAVPVLTNQVTVQAPFVQGGDTEPVSKVPFSANPHAAPTPLVLGTVNQPRDDRTPLIFGTVPQPAAAQSHAAPKPSERPNVLAGQAATARPSSPPAISHLADQPTRAVAPVVAQPPVAHAVATHAKSIPPSTAPPVSTGVPAVRQRVPGPLLKDRGVKVAAFAALIVGTIVGSTYGILATRTPDEAAVASSAAAPLVIDAPAAQPASPSPTPADAAPAPPAANAAAPAPAAAPTASVVAAATPAAEPARGTAPRAPAPSAKLTATKPAAGRTPTDADLQQRLEWLDTPSKPKPAPTTSSSAPPKSFTLRSRETVF